MNQLIFVAIATMSCGPGVPIPSSSGSHGFLSRCSFKEEVIVRAEDLKKLKDYKYILGTFSSKIEIGCLIETTDNRVYIGGKPCRRILGSAR